ncbi:hypothetical protein Tco_0205689 [Tanacetum coccineum]
MPTVHEDSPVEEVPAPMKRTTKRRQTKKTVRNDEEKQCTPWTTQEEIALCKAWVRISTDTTKKKGAASSASSNEEALAKLMIRKRELELKEQELKMREYEQRSRDETFYLQPIDHLTRVHLDRALEMKRPIKERWNLPY